MRDAIGLAKAVLARYQCTCGGREQSSGSNGVTFGDTPFTLEHHARQLPDFHMLVVASRHQPLPLQIKGQSSYRSLSC